MNTEALSQTIRLPRPAFEGQKGFQQHFTDVETITDQNLEDALDRQRRFEFFLQYQKRDVPSIEAMEAEVEQKDDEAAIQKQIEYLRTSHYEDLERLYDLDAEEYAESIQWQYDSRDHANIIKESKEEERTATLALFEDERQRLQIGWYDHFEQLRHTYLSQFLELSQTKERVAIEQELQRKQQEKMFPQSKEDFESKSQEVRLRVAKFLVAEPARQERFLTEYGWAWRQVQPLNDIFKKDYVFAAKLRGMVISQQQNVTDPRKPRPAA